MLFAEFQHGTSGDLALLLHVAGAMILVGGLATAATAGIIGWNGQSVALRRLSYWTLLLVAFPGYIAMHVGAEWIYSSEGWSDPDPSWIGIGYITADVGGLFFLIALILGGIGIRKLRSGGGSGLLRASSVLATLLVLVYVVTIWAMGAKPT
jgi:hypothetical protein